MKWLFTDFDNTVEVTNDEETTIKNFDFLRRWHKAGNKVIFASGRPVEMLKLSSDKDELESDYFISNNGAFTYDKDLKILDEVYITSDNRKDILNILDNEAKTGACIIYILPEGRQGYSVSEIVDYPLGNFLSAKEFFFPNGINEENRKNDILHNDKLLGIYFIGNFKTDYQKIANQFLTFKNVRAIKTAPVLLEIIPNNVSKARGIEIISEIHSINIKDIYTAGDNDNDKEMLENYPNSFVVEHGTKVAKDAAKHVIKHLYDLEKII